MKRVFLLASCVLVVALSGCIGATRLEPGVAAVKIDYANGGKRTDIPAGGYIQYNPITERIAEYPIGQQTLSMVRNENEGQVKGDDTVEVRVKGIPVHIDTHLFWRVDALHVADMFLLRPNVPLIGKTLNDGIDGIVVRGLTRSTMQDAGATFDSYADVYSTKRQQFQDDVSRFLGCPTSDPNDPLNTVDPLTRTSDPTTRLGKEFIICDRFQIGEIYLEPEQQKAVSDLQNSLTTVQTSANLAESAKNTAAASAAPVIANAQAEATAIALREEALKDSPHVLTYDVAIAQANHPALVQGSNSQVQIPLSALQTPVPSPAVSPTAAVTPSGTPVPSR